MISAEGSFEERIRARLCAAREAASKGETASILFGGDPSVFSSSWRALEPSVLGQTEVHVSPGVGAFSAAASRVGAPLVGDFALLSGRDDDTPDRVSRLAEGALPSSSTTRTQASSRPPPMPPPPSTRRGPSPSSRTLRGPKR